MPLHPLLKDMVSADLYQALALAESGDYSTLSARLAKAKAGDSHMLPYAAEEGTKYYKPFVQTIEPKIMPAIKQALANGTLPEITVDASELVVTQKLLGIGDFGSPQDVCYGFTSERYTKWGPTLDAMGFHSACMVGEAQMLVTMAPRFLTLGNPQFETLELAGAIPTDFWESRKVVFTVAPFKENIESICELTGAPNPFVGLTKKNVDAVVATLDAVLITALAWPTDLTVRMRAAIVQEDVADLKNLKTESGRFNRLGRLINASVQFELDSAQEQIALKYVEEGKFLQKLLGGHRVDHLQSNVKMQTNPFRKNKCEVDSIYRVVGEPHIVLVEAKDKATISRTQLYQIYETFRLRMPPTWKVTVVAALISDPDDTQKQQDVKSVIDLAEIYFDDSKLGQITESIAAIKPQRHYRWLIKQ